MTVEEYFEYDQDTIPFKECSTRDAEEYDYNGEEPPYSKYEMIAFAKGYYEKQLALCDVVKSLPSKEEKQFEKINSFNRLKKDIPELDQVMYCTGFVTGVKWLEKQITK